MKKPIVGVTTLMIDDEKYMLVKENVEAIQRAGGVPIMLPHDESAIDTLFPLLDGVLLTGGHDIDPYVYGEEPHPNVSPFTQKRDAFELQLTQRCLVEDVPVLGICRGSQMLNVAAGGTLYQDLATEWDGTRIQHEQKTESHYATHTVEVMEHSIVHSIFGKTHIRTNSFHHQAVKQVGDTFYASAWAADGVIEAIESRAYRFAVGIQWHPELTIRTDEGQSQQLFDHFVRVCRS